MRDGHIVVCDACEKSYEAHIHNELIDDGWLLDANQFGYYSGFSDSLADEDEDHPWKLCHDCIVTLLTALPRLGERLGKGQHPSRKGDKPCCRWCWIFRTNDDGSLTTLVATDDGHGWQEADDENTK